MNQKRKKLIFRIVLCAIMASLAIVLDKISLNMGIVKITFYALPLIVVGLVEGFIPGLISGVIAGTVLQLTSQYGITPTAPFWALAPIAWGAIPGLVATISTKKGFKNYPVIVTISVVTASIIANLLNTFAMVMDTLLVKDAYYTMATILTNWPTRLLIMLVNMVPYIIISLTSMQAIKNAIYGEELEAEKKKFNFLYAVFYLSILTFVISSFILIDIVLNKYKTYILVFMIINTILSLTELVLDALFMKKELSKNEKIFFNTSLILASISFASSVVLIFSIGVIR